MKELLNDQYISTFLQNFENSKQEVLKHCLIIGIDYIKTFMNKSSNLLEDLKLNSDKIKKQFVGEFNTNEAIKSLKEQMNELHEKVEQKFNKSQKEIDINTNEMALTQQPSSKQFNKYNSITPKITEIPLSNIKNQDQNKSVLLTRHHLNDDQIRASFQETDYEQTEISHCSSQKFKLDQSQQQQKESEKKPPTKPKQFYKNYPEISLTSQSEETESNFIRSNSPNYEKQLSSKFRKDLSCKKQQQSQDSVSSNYRNNQHSSTNSKNQGQFLKKNRNTSNASIKQQQEEATTTTTNKRTKNQQQQFIGSQKYQIQKKENQKPAKSNKKTVPAYLRNVCSKIKSQIQIDKMKNQTKQKTQEKFDFVQNENINNQNFYQDFSNNDNCDEFQLNTNNNNNYNNSIRNYYDNQNLENYSEQQYYQSQNYAQEENLENYQNEEQLRQQQIQEQQMQYQQQQQQLYAQQQQQLSLQQQQESQQQNFEQENYYQQQEQVMQSDKPCAIIENFLNSPILQFFQQNEQLPNPKDKLINLNEQNLVQSPEINNYAQQYQQPQRKSQIQQQNQIPLPQTTQRKKWSNVQQSIPTDQQQPENAIESLEKTQNFFIFQQIQIIIKGYLNAVMETHRFLEFKECQCKSKQKQEALDNFLKIISNSMNKSMITQAFFQK